MRAFLEEAIARRLDDAWGTRWTSRPRGASPWRVMRRRPVRYRIASGRAGTGLEGERDRPGPLPLARASREGRDGGRLPGGAPRDRAKGRAQDRAGSPRVAPGQPAAGDPGAGARPAP